MDRTGNSIFEVPRYVSPKLQVIFYGSLIRRETIAEAVLSLRYGTTFKFQLFGHYMIALSSPAAVSNFLRDRSGTFTVINFQQTHEFCGIGGGEKHYAYLYSVLERKLAPTATRCLSRRFLNNIIPTLISRLLEDVTKMVHDDTRSLHELVHRILYHSATAALFGPLFPVETYSDFMEYDEGVGFIAKYLPGLAPKSVEARSHLVAAYSRYFNAAWRDETGGFLEGASDVMSEMYRELRATELSYDEAARLMVHVTWAFNVNIMRVTTWVMCHILTDKDVYDRVCEEIRTFVDTHFPNFAGLESMDFKTLDDGQFQLLSSITQEVLRTKSSNVSMREATQDTVIMDENDVAILVRKGEYVMADMQSMHNSENLQRDPGQFQADRFLEKPSYKSVVFGAGQHMVSLNVIAAFLTHSSSPSVCRTPLRQLSHSYVCCGDSVSLRHKFRRYTFSF